MKKTPKKKTTKAKSGSARLFVAVGSSYDGWTYGIGIYRKDAIEDFWHNDGSQLSQTFEVTFPRPKTPEQQIPNQKVKV